MPVPGMGAVAFADATRVPARYSDPRSNFRCRNVREQRLNSLREYIAREPIWLRGCVPFRARLCVPLTRCHMLGARFRAERGYSPNSRGILKAFGRAVNCTVSTVGASVLNWFPASAADVFRCRPLYFGHVAALDFALVPLSEARGDEPPSELGRRRRFRGTE